MKFWIISAVIAVVAAETASADCQYQGQSYGTGSVICASGGWLQECTVADYWKTIGQCRTDDPNDPTNYTAIPEAAATPDVAEPEKAAE